MRLQLKLGVVAITAALTATAAPSAVQATVIADDPVYTGRFSNVAVDGVDVIELFAGTVTKGEEQFQTLYKGAEWRFSSQENLERFIADPAAFAPQYGGYCAWAIADGKYAKGSAKHWAIVDGKLYLNYNRSIQKKWNKDTTGFIERGDAQWSTLQGETSEPAGYGS